MAASVYTVSEVDALLAERDARLDAIELRLNGEPPVDPPDPPIDPPIDPPPQPTGDTIGPGVILYEELHVHEGKTLRVLPGTTLIRRDVPPANPDHANGGIVVHGRLLATREANEPDIVFTSENPNGHRGHLMFHADGSQLDGVKIIDMGRTRIEPLSAENPIGLYACHWHQAGDCPNSFIRNSEIYDTVPGFRHGIVPHGSHGIRVENNFIHHKSGAGVYIEDGDERNNFIVGNLIEDILGTGALANSRQGDWGHEGSGIWAHGGGNTIRNNTIRRCTRAGLIVYDWSGVPFTASDLTIEDCGEAGFEPWFAFVPGSLVERFTIRRCLHGVRNYNFGNWTLNDFTIEDCRDRGWNGGDYSEVNVVINRLTVRGCPAGLVPSALQKDYERRIAGPLTVNGYVAENNGADVVYHRLWNNGGGSMCPERTVTITNADLRSPTKVVMGVGPNGWNAVRPDRLTINGTRYYFPDQKADDICPQSNGLNVGCPDPEQLTNAQALAKHGVCVAGEIAP